jgi:uncharacterized membrane protein
MPLFVIILWAWACSTGTYVGFEGAGLPLMSSIGFSVSIGLFILFIGFCFSILIEKIQRLP